MRRRFEVLRAPEDEGAGGGSGSDTHRVDPGAPHEVGGLEHEDGDDDRARRPAKDDRAAQLEKDLADERKAREDSEADARYWAARARRIAADSDEQPAPRQAERVAAPAAAAPVEMTPEQLVDGLNKEGLSVLRKAGFISQAEMDAKVDALRNELTGTIRAERSDAEFGGRIAQEFPTLARESSNIARAKAAGRDYVPSDPLFKLAGELYREAIADDPTLEGNQGIILSTARMAQRLIDSEGKGSRRNDRDGEIEQGAHRGAGPVGDRDTNGRFQRTPETPARRRDRIERQRPDRGEGDDENSRDREHFTPEQQTVMDKLGVKPERFAAQRDAATRSQEGRRSGRR